MNMSDQESQIGEVLKPTAPFVINEFLYKDVNEAITALKNKNRDSKLVQLLESGIIKDEVSKAHALTPDFLEKCFSMNGLDEDTVGIQGAVFEALINQLNETSSNIQVAKMQDLSLLSASLRNEAQVIAWLSPLLRNRYDAIKGSNQLKQSRGNLEGAENELSLFCSNLERFMLGGQIISRLPVDQPEIKNQLREAFQVKKTKAS